MQANKISVLLSFLIFGLAFSHLHAQGTKIGSPKVSSAFPQQNFGADNHYLLREAERQLSLLDFEQADITLDYAVAQNPQSIDALVQRAKYNRMLGRRAKAAADIGLVNRLNPYAADLYGYNGPGGLLNVLAFIPYQNEALFKAFPDQLLPYYFAITERSVDRRSVEVERLRGILHLMEAGEWANAGEKLDGLLWVFPESGLGLELKAMILIIQANWNKAEIALNKAAVMRPESALLWCLFSRLEQLRGNYARAKAYANRAIELQPTLGPAYLQRAELRKIEGDFSAAVDDYNMGIEQSDLLGLEALVRRGLTRKLAGDFQAALADLNQVLEIAPEKALLYKNRANLYLLFGFTNLAIADYTAAIERKEDFVEAYYNRGLAHLLRYDPLTACYDLERSADLGFGKAAEMQRFFCIE